MVRPVGIDRSADAALLPCPLIQGTADRSLFEVPLAPLTTFAPSRVRFPSSGIKKEQTPKLSVCSFGAPGGNRTHGLYIRSVLLYPLSYERMFLSRGGNPALFYGADNGNRPVCCAALPLRSLFQTAQIITCSPVHRTASLTVMPSRVRFPCVL